ncbi:putative ribonuclease iii protein [Botrytis fragariae]|uniref:Putative ribonuclease iii protein n=1 Tax=Botrytis fragariae TaxID=1964551 RepID=A0A8H6APB9_9HELO|nr:putative ribonuclease iii protein [Botrytis fragariae]KAF5871137.1 putative ribonuclease iii protein [Botrytis fragariae]
MTDEQYLKWLQSSIDYMFCKYDLLQSALITPGFTGDKVGDWEKKNEYEGNRTLAHIGDSIVPLVIRHKLLLVDGMSRAVASDTSTCIASRKHQEERANLLGIATHLKLNKSLNGKANSTTLRLALCSIIGAAWLDCGQNFAIITKVVHRLLIDPMILDKNPRKIFPEDAVVMVPGFSDECTFSYETPSTYLANSSLEMLIADPIDDYNCFQVFPGDNFLNTTISSEATDIVHQYQDAAASNQTQDATALDTASSVDPTASIPMLFSGSAHSHDACQTMPISEPGNASKISIKKRKRKSHMDSVHSRVSISDYLSDYMRLEKERCHNLGSSFTNDDFDMAMKIASPGLKPDDIIFNQLKMLYFAIGSGESLVSLRSLLKIRRRSVAGKSPMETNSLTIVERMKQVEHLNTKIAYNVFERRYHIYHLYTESRSLHNKTSDGFVNTTSQSILTNSASRMGNPLNLDESQVTKKMLNLLHPNLDPGTTEYQKKLRNISKIRKLGERFEILVRKFGYGIIGLLPLPVDDIATESAVYTSDSLVSSSNDTVFLSFVQCLDQLKGKILRDISSAVCPIVTVLFEKKIDPFWTFPIEQFDTKQILQYSSGSRQLLELISGQQDSNFSGVIRGVDSFFACTGDSGFDVCE